MLNRLRNSIRQFETSCARAVAIEIEIHSRRAIFLAAVTDMGLGGIVNRGCADDARRKIEPQNV
jgi:hypothetical protein